MNEIECENSISFKVVVFKATNLDIFLIANKPEFMLFKTNMECIFSVS